MKLSEYVITEGTGLYMDPLGFLRPYAALQDMLFKQFTVLSNHPSYHGMLTLIYQLLAKNGIVPIKEGFSREFRDMEILWGLANSARSDSILNTTKYQRLLIKGKIRLKDIPARDTIYYRLNYGTLGHYSSPSSFWGLLSKDGTALKGLGPVLADAYDMRGHQQFSGWCSRWYGKGAEIDLSDSSFLAFADAFKISCPPSKAEQDVWKEIILNYCGLHPEVKVLWDAPFTQVELDTFGKTFVDYSKFFFVAKQKYPSVASILHLWELFEQISALAQLIFIREYLLCRPDAKGFNFAEAGPVSEQVASLLLEKTKEYVTLQYHQDARTLFQSLSTVSDYKSVATIILRHHSEHQRAKGVAPFLQDNQLLVIDKFDKDKFAQIWESLDEGNRDQILNSITFNYKRDWHFGRASLYSKYAGNLS